MRAIFDRHGKITVELPFEHITARAIIVRREDGCLLGMKHRADGRYAPPGGHMENGESPDETVLRELDEEGLELVAPDPRWREWLAVDAFMPTAALNIWFVFLVDDVTVRPNSEGLSTRWFDPAEDVWYPEMREKIRLALQRYLQNV